MTGLGTPRANLLIPDLITYSGPINFAAETGNVTVTAATLAAAGSSSGGYGPANGMVFDAITVGVSGAHDAETTAQPSQTAAVSPTTVAPVDATPTARAEDSSASASLATASVSINGPAAEPARASASGDGVNVAAPYYAGAEFSSAGPESPAVPGEPDQVAKLRGVRLTLLGRRCDLQ